MCYRYHVINVAQCAAVDVTNTELSVLERIEVDRLYIAQDLDAKVV